MDQFKHQTHPPVHNPIMSWVPADLHTEEKDEARLPNRPKARGENWEQAQRVALANPSDVRKWDALFGIFEQQAQQTGGTPETLASLKKAVSANYSTFLQRFPFATAYWKQYSILQYKLYGPHESIECLEKAVNAHPQSVVLWGDYLAGLVAMEAETWKTGTKAKEIETKEAETKEENSKEQETVKKDSDVSQKGSKYTVDFIRGQFLRAETLIGTNFNSDSFWDKFIAFEISISQRTPDQAASVSLLALYLRLLRVPLYQYAQYYAQFGEFSKNFGAKDVIPDDYMPEYLARFGKGDVSELSVIESSQLVDLYAYDIFLQTQQVVTEKWQFESALTIQDFSPMDPSIAASQFQSWLDYLSHEIQAFSALEKKVAMPVFQIVEGDNGATGKNLLEASNSAEIRKFLSVQSVFERALVPNSTKEELWLKYIDFVQENTENGDDQVRGLYEKAIFSFLPLKCSEIRKKYAQYLLKEHSFDAATEFWLRAIRLYSGPQRIYAKEAYLQSVKEMVSMWTEHAEVQAVLESLCGTYFTRVDRYKTGSKTEPKDEGANEKGVKKEGKEEKVKGEHVNQLSRALNDDGIAVVAVGYLRSPETSIQAIRSFYNRYHTQNAFSRSVQFWRFFVDFEIGEKNLENLKTVMDYIETSTELPKRVIDCFLDMQYEATTANLSQVFSSPNKEALQEILVLLNAKKSDDLVVNVSARKRLAQLNYLETENRQLDRDASLMKLRAKHLAHPGIFVDHVPQLTNSTMGREWISLLDDDLKVPPLPIFKNVEKANAPIVYPDE